MKTFLLIFTVLFCISVLPNKAKANLIGNVHQDTFVKVGELVNNSYKNIITAINKECDAITKKIGKSMAVTLAIVYKLWFTYKIVNIIINRGNLLTLLPSFFVATVCFLFLYNISIFNKLFQVPLLKTYETFGGIIMSSNSTSDKGIITDIATNMSSVFDALNNSSGNLITNFGAIFFALVTMIMLFLVFLVIFLILIKNYMKIMFPFVFSPIFIVCFAFPSLRPISIKAINIVFDGILKQGCLLFAIKVMSLAFYSSLSLVKDNLSIAGMLSIIVLGMVYREIVAVAENISSELLGTQSLGHLPSVNMLSTSAIVGGMLSLASKFRSQANLFNSRGSNNFSSINNIGENPSDTMNSNPKTGINSWKKTNE